VDLKFLTLREFAERIETPVIFLDKNGVLKSILEQTEAKFPYPDYQWIEDRFWIWVHYVLLKIGRGEYVKAFDFFSFMRMVVFGPLLHIKNYHVPRGVCKVQTQLPAKDFALVQATLPSYSRASLLAAIQNSVILYSHLRQELFYPETILQTETEKRVMEYFKDIERP
jgi:hypothetical protein